MTPNPRWDALPTGQDRGTLAMSFFITTEALLFVVMLFGYIYVGHERPRWPPSPPKLHWPLTMLAVLLTSSAVLYLGERAAHRGAQARAKLAVAVTMTLGLVFLALQGVEYRTKLGELTPTTSAYGSFFYTITSIHALHVVVGLFMLAYVLLLPRIDLTKDAPHRALLNAGLYWHFVDAVWVVLVTILYVIPRVRG